MKEKPLKGGKFSKLTRDQDSLHNQNVDLRARLDEAEETLRAITSGEVDAFVVETGGGQQVFTLRSSEHPYRAMVEAMNEGAATLLPDGTIIYCNHQLAALVHEKASKVSGTPFVNYVAIRDRAAFEASFLQAKTKPSKVEVFLTQDDGSLTSTQISMAAVDLDGTSAISIVVTDLTEQKQNEALIVSEKLTRSILEQAAEAIIVCDEHGTIIRANPAAHALANVNLFARRFDHSFKLVKADGRTFSMAEISAVDQQTRGLAVTFDRADGETFILSLSVSHLRNSDVPLGFVFTLTDITALRSTEAALRFQSHVTETIAKNAVSCLIMLDQHGSPTFMNPAAEKVTGHTLDEIRGRHIHSVLHYKRPDGTRYEVVDSPLWNSTRALSPGIEREENFVRRNGSFFPVSYSLAPLVSDGRDIGTVLEFRDITQQKRNENELKIAKESAESASNLKTAFLANMSHEIRTPLGAILGFTEMLKEPDLSREAQQEYLEIISRSGTALARLIDDILDLSKVEAGKLNVEKIRFSPSELLSEVFAMFSESAKKKSISLRLLKDESLPPYVKSDPTRLRQILVNVLGNAVKFTSAGSVVVEASFKNDKLIVKIVDTGAGLSRQQRERLFEPFSQGDNSTTRKFGGSGLGLILSRRLARALGGDVILEKTTVGKGSTFAIEVALERDDRTMMPAKSPTAQMKRLDGVKVLVVEDSPDNQNLLELLLSKSGASVSLANNGREGVDTALDGKFDVVLMDIQMPILDGYEATTELRRAGYTAPIVALTAYAMEEERLRCLSIGCNAHLSKPINPAMLTDTLASILAARSAHA